MYKRRDTVSSYFDEPENNECVIKKKHILNVIKIKVKKSHTLSDVSDDFSLNPARKYFLAIKNNPTRFKIPFDL